MLYCIQCEDKAGRLDIRMANRDAHLAYIANFKVFTAGPTFAEDGETMNGSVIIIDCEDNAALKDYMDNDPYVTAGLFASVKASRWKKVIHNPEV